MSLIYYGCEAHICPCHRAWTLPPVYDNLRYVFSSRGFPSEAPAHPSVDAEPPNKTFDGDVSNLKDVCIGLVEQGRAVVLVMHSYGGLVGPGAVEGLAKKDREAECRYGGVILLVYMAAMAIPKGMSTRDLMGGQFLEYMRVEICCRFSLPVSSSISPISPRVRADYIQRGTMSTASSTMKIHTMTSRLTSAENGLLHSLTRPYLSFQRQRRSSRGTVFPLHISNARIIGLSRFPPRKGW